jgi:hypothetical protein
MKLALVGAVAVTLLAASAGQAAPRKSDRARRAEAPRLLKDALRDGDADIQAFAAIADWILTEKEETVAAGLSDVLSGLDLAPRGASDQRWAATTQAMVSLFKSVLRDARDDRRRSGDETDAEVAALMSAAAPAVAAALAEADSKIGLPFRDALRDAAGRCEARPAH